MAASPLLASTRPRSGTAPSGALLSSAPEYRYLERSIAAFPAPAEFEEMMRGAGLEPHKRTRFFLGVCHLFLGVSQPKEPAR